MGWLLHALTGSWPAAVVVGGGVASILLVLAVGGARYNQRYAVGTARQAEARARRDLVLEAMRVSRRKADGAPETDQ